MFFVVVVFFQFKHVVSVLLQISSPYGDFSSLAAHVHLSLIFSLFVADCFSNLSDHIGAGL